MQPTTSSSLATHDTAGAAPVWMRRLLLAAAVYNIVWGTFVVLAPGALFDFSGIEPPRYPAIWQCVGMIVGVCGVGYWLAAGDVFRYWPIVLVGLLGKIFGPAGFVYAAARGELPWSWGVTILANDLIWWAPFAAILYQTYRRHVDSDWRDIGAFDSETNRVISTATSQQGDSIVALSQSGPLLVLLLRHAGCTFCRQALADVGATSRSDRGGGHSARTGPHG